MTSLQRNGDPFVGGMKGSSSEGYLNRVGSNMDDSFNLGAGMAELTGTVSTAFPSNIQVKPSISKI